MISPYNDQGRLEEFAFYKIVTDNITTKPSVI